MASSSADQLIDHCTHIEIADPRLECDYWGCYGHVVVFEAEEDGGGE